jgi:hypothetical protein
MAVATRFLLLLFGLTVGCADQGPPELAASAELISNRYIPNDLHFDAKVARQATPGSRTTFVCSLLGLGAIDTIPFNFPGASREELDQYQNRRSLVIEEALAPGPNPSVARVYSTDMGWPFEHSDGYVYFTFDDGLFSPQSAMSECPPGASNCTPVALNDDFLARSDPRGWSSDSRCIPLEIDSAPDEKEFQPITLNGPVSSGGTPTGPDVVPGPGFSSGRYVFLLMPLAGASCTSDAGCAAASGVATDVCLPHPALGGQYCHFGTCDGDSPCAVRLSPSTLVVRSEGSNFVVPRVGEHVANANVLNAYRGHFATVSFQARVDASTNSGVVWVLGRDSYWGTPGLPMNPYLMFHPVENGVLGEPQYFTGTDVAGSPVFAADANAAVPLYEERPTLPYHTSLAFFSELEGGTWLLIYGGHAQPSLKDRVSLFIKPASDSLFYDTEAGIYLRWSRQPWGPWSTPATIFNPFSTDGGYCKEMFFDDPSGKTGFACPAELAARNESLDRMPYAGMAGEYGASIVPRSLQIAEDGQHATFLWLMSTWNPYRVVELETAMTLPLEETAPATISTIVNP